MGIFGKLFGSKTTDDTLTVPSVPLSPVRTIGYDAGLVGSLKHDHAELVALYQRIGQLQQAGRYAEIRAELVNFKTRFEAHLLTENVRFYTYLEQSLTTDAHNAELMRDFRREMNTIARGVVDFVKRYQPVAFDDAQRAQFAEDYKAIGGLLSQRIEREESNLYPLYQPG
ncbi:hypothetical protein ASG87_00750 [Frateuria sp. Soil773]|uniref:hemerythrin domain-containing protein n=1 Tax=Frateuria sp. Soil773 TaxID=1736407 RepID=UPI0006F65049|nr:hemerythrin domain-containing protein [Frateuria sp. Soil773]KRE92478.1 hypothetical protein ASG87_00750 [Frateuria sp. Soil773]